MVKGHVSQGQIRVPNKGRWAHDKIKLLYLQILSIVLHKYYRFGKRNSTLFAMSEEKIKKHSRWAHFEVVGGIEDQRI